MTEHIREDGLAGVDQVVDLLEAYADARLNPRGAVLARMRRQVMAEAAARVAAEDARLEMAIAAAEGKRHSSPFAITRRVATVGLAAALMFGTSAAVLAAGPGSRFYDARVQLEEMFLPANADDRVAAHERHLQDRLAEAQTAAERGDLVALEAALAAYRAEVDDAVADVGTDPALLAHLEAALATHTSVLQALAARLPEQAAIEHALEASRKAASKLHEKGKPATPGQPQPRVTPAPVGDEQQETSNQR